MNLYEAGRALLQQLNLNPIANGILRGLLEQVKPMVEQITANTCPLLCPESKALALRDFAELDAQPEYQTRQIALLLPNGQRVYVLVVHPVGMLPETAAAGATLPAGASAALGAVASPAQA